MQTDEQSGAVASVPSDVLNRSAPQQRWAGSVSELASHRRRERSSSPRPGGRWAQACPETEDFTPNLAAGAEAASVDAARPDFSAPAAPEKEAPSAPRGAVRAPAHELRNMVRWRIEQNRLAWRSDYRRNAPCWLTSMVLHMILMIVLGSLAIPPGARRFLGATLLASFAERQDLPADSRPVLVSMDLARDEGGHLGDRTQSDSGDDTQPASRLQGPAVELAEARTEIVSQLRPPTDLGTPVAEVAEEKTDEAPGKRQPAPQGGVASAARIAPPDKLPSAPAEQAPSAEPESAEERRLDGVVNRFIEYDIGRLRGAAGERARRELDQLGPEAIRALVRGLNRSARIHASCPVVVLANKLSETVGRNSDPEVLQYVVDNLGKDVPKTAPHASRLRSLRAWLLHEAEEAPVASNDAARLAQQLNGASAADRLAAARHVVEHIDKFSQEERTKLAWPLIRRLSDRPMEMRDAARQALVALAGGEDFGPPAGERATTRAVSDAAAKWYDHFDHQRYETMAAAVLASARHFEDARRKTSAIRYYRKLLDEYAGTEAAREAGGRLAALTGVPTN
jgi:hypothetical protein